MRNDWKDHHRKQAAALRGCRLLKRQQLTKIYLVAERGTEPASALNTESVRKLFVPVLEHTAGFLDVRRVKILSRSRFSIRAMVPVAIRGEEQNGSVGW